MPDNQAVPDTGTRVAKLDPVFDDEVLVILSANQLYVPYVSVVLQSLKEHANPQRNYDVVVLNSDITIESQRTLTHQVQGRNFVLRFYDAMGIMHRFSDLRVYGHFKLETYFRLIVPEIMPNSNKAVYLDSDLVVLRDIADLFDVQIGDNLIGATHDADTAGMYDGYDPDMKAYIDNVLKLGDPYDYFQAGVLLLNLEAFRNSYTTSEMLNCAASRKWTLLDQDVLNYLANGRVHYVDMAWNTLMDWEHIRRDMIIGTGPLKLRDAYEQARQHPYVVHYAGPDNKPWEFRDADLGAYFWEYAAKSPYREQLCCELEAAMTSPRYRAKRIGHFWLNQVVMRNQGWIAPPNSKRRRVIYDIYHQLGGTH